MVGKDGWSRRKAHLTRALILPSLVSTSFTPLLLFFCTDHAYNWSLPQYLATRYLKSHHIYTRTTHTAIPTYPVHPTAEPFLSGPLTSLPLFPTYIQSVISSILHPESQSHFSTPIPSATRDTHDKGKECFRNTPAGKVHWSRHWCNRRAVCGTLTRERLFSGSIFENQQLWFVDL